MWGGEVDTLQGESIVSHGPLAFPVNTTIQILKLVWEVGCAHMHQDSKGICTQLHTLHGSPHSVGTHETAFNGGWFVANRS